MAGSTKNIEKRLAKLEEAVRQLQDLMTPKPEEPWWKRLAGIHAGDEAYEAIASEGRKIREAERKAAQDDKEKDETLPKRPPRSGRAKVKDAG
jgi:hypothetical protein